jgi:hypothetical protein
VHNEKLQNFLLSGTEAACSRVRSFKDCPLSI